MKLKITFTSSPRSLNKVIICSKSMFEKLVVKMFIFINCSDRTKVASSLLKPHS